MCSSSLDLPKRDSMSRFGTYPSLLNLASPRTISRSPQRLNYVSKFSVLLLPVTLCASYALAFFLKKPVFLLFPLFNFQTTRRNSPFCSVCFCKPSPLSAVAPLPKKCTSLALFGSPDCLLPVSAGFRLSVSCLFRRLWLSQPSCKWLKSRQ